MGHPIILGVYQVKFFFDIADSVIPPTEYRFLTPQTQGGFVVGDPRFDGKSPQQIYPFACPFRDKKIKNQKKPYQQKNCPIPFLAYRNDTESKDKRQIKTARVSKIDSRKQDNEQKPRPSTALVYVKPRKAENRAANAGIKIDAEGPVIMRIPTKIKKIDQVRIKQVLDSCKNYGYDYKD